MSADGSRESKFTLFHFPSHKDKIPEDYFTDKETGMRPGENRPPSGVTKTFIDKGFTDWTLFPPNEIWKKGVWFEMLTDEQKLAIGSTVGNNKWETWVVNGEGSPGNFLCRLYVVNDDAAADVEPLHPLLWLEKYKRPVGYSIGRGAQPSPGYTSHPGGHGWQYQGAQTTVVKTQQAPALPRGIRFRCADCGHWFEQDELGPHKTNCCPGKEASRESDWAILCECCKTLDEVSACKPGFPRPKKEVAPKEKTESKQDAAEATAEVVQ